MTDLETYTEEIWFKVLSTAGTLPTDIKVFYQLNSREVRVRTTTNTIYLKAKNLAPVSDVENSKIVNGIALKLFWYHVLVQYSKPTTTMRLFWNHRLAVTITVDYNVF